MATYEWLEKDGKKIFYMNIASANLEELDNKLKELRPIIDAQPQGSLLTITDTTNGHFNNEMTKSLNVFTEANKPYIKMTAVIGVDGLKRMVYKGAMVFSKRDNLVIKDSKQEAIDFLASL